MQRLLTNTQITRYEVTKTLLEFYGAEIDSQRVKHVLSKCRGLLYGGRG